MITIEGQDFYNYAEALHYLFSLYEDVYTKEEIDEIISNIPQDITEEQIQTLINEALTNYTTKEELNTAISELNQYILAMQGSMSELRNTVNATSQFLIETMEDVDAVEEEVALLKPRIEAAENKIDKLEETKLYRHNVFLYYKHIAENLFNDGDGMIQASFTLINTDKDAYTFDHNTGSNPSEQVMSLESAWQLTRLYQAIALSTNKNTEEMARACSGICLVAKIVQGSRVLMTCPNILITTNYTGTDGTGWQRNIKVSCYSSDVSKFGAANLSIACGHPIFELNGNEISVWQTEQEFEKNEYNSYANYFCQHTVYCRDRVEEILNLDNV